MTAERRVTSRDFRPRPSPVVQPGPPVSRKVLPGTALPAILRCRRVAESGIDSRSVDMLKGERIAAANLTEWRKLAQGLHAAVATNRSWQ